MKIGQKGCCCYERNKSFWDLIFKCGFVNVFGHTVDLFQNAFQYTIQKGHSLCREEMCGINQNFKRIVS